MLRDIVYGIAVGDSVGVPVEFKSREYLEDNPVTDMIGYGTYGQPSGTWSDDTSMALCLVAMINEGYDLRVLARNFINWYDENEFTARGEVFDVGMTTQKSIHNLMTSGGLFPELCGLDSDDSQSNGSLMRILPILSHIHERYKIVSDVSSLTHRHEVAIFACFFLVEFAKCIRKYQISDRYSVLEGCYDEVCYDISQSNIKISPEFSRIFAQNGIADLDKDEIKSDGFVVHTLEAALWCFYNTHSYKEAVLAAVNLGDDTDTTAAVAGGVGGDALWI